jgi:diguanylate cyclase (GGDEF)-like protein
MSAGSSDRVRPAWTVLAWAILVGGIGASVVGGRATRSAAQHQAAAALTSASADIADSIGSQLQRDTDFTANQAALLGVLPDLNNTQFKELFDSIGVDQRYPGGAGFVYFERVEAAQLAAFVNRLEADPVTGVPITGTFSVLPSGPRPEYCLQRLGVVKGKPTVPLAPGYDACVPRITGFGPSPTATALRAAQDSGHLTILAPSPGYPAIGLVMLAPVYRGGLVPTTIDDRHHLLVGWITGSFDGPADMSTASGSHHGLSIELSRQDLSTGPAVVARAGTVGAGHVSRQAVTVDADGQWIVRVSGSLGAGGLSPWTQGIGVLGAGVTVSVLMFLLVRTLIGSGARALQLVDKKTGELRHQALHDELTGLPNRALILDRVEQMLTRTRRQRAQIAALFIDLDNFKDVNDALGHDTGDQLLREVATRLTSFLRESDTVGRLGGDEFVVLIEGVSLAAGPDVVAERLLDVLREPFQLGGPPAAPLLVTASIGIALGDRPSAGELLRDADIALYQAKAAGKDRHIVFLHAMQTAVQDRHVLETDLRGALVAGQFFLVYQPVFDLHHMTVTGVEGLIRWRHPTRGIVLPDSFIPLLEETGMIVTIGRWVLDQACAQAAAWRERGHDLTMAVNVSARQLESDQLVDDVREALTRSGIAAASLVIEVTETALMRDADATAQRLTMLKALGVRIAIDDFGTGYSSLAYLRQFPVDSLKIDRSFISGFVDSAESATLLHTMVHLGKTLGLETLAEGIETNEQLSRLRSEQCRSGQGFLFARPLDVQAVEQFLDSWRPDATLVDAGAVLGTT